MVWGNLHNLISQNMKGKGLLYFLSQNPNHAFAYLTTGTKSERKELINFESSALEGEIEQFKVGILEEQVNSDFLSKLQYLDIKTYMVDDVLTKVDRASMMNSLEVRVPFLDHKFAELTFKIPSNLKLKGKDNKYILKKSMEPHLPKSI